MRVNTNYDRDNSLSDIEMPESSLPRIRPILALTADMIFASRVKSTADAVGAPLQLVRNADQMLRLATEVNPRLIVIDPEH